MLLKVTAAYAVLALAACFTMLYASVVVGLVVLVLAGGCLGYMIGVSAGWEPDWYLVIHQQTVHRIVTRVLVTYVIAMALGAVAAPIMVSLSGGNHVYFWIWAGFTYPGYAALVPTALLWRHRQREIARGQLIAI